MSQNRQAARDRLAASLDYEINLKAEVEIMALHDKLDRIRLEHLEEMLHDLMQRVEELTHIKATSRPMRDETNAARELVPESRTGG
jgi:uncharacterized membrane protein